MLSKIWPGDPWTREEFGFIYIDATPASELSDQSIKHIGNPHYFMCPVMCYMFLWRKSKELILVTKEAVQQDVMVIVRCAQENMGTQRKALCSPSKRDDV